MTTRRRAMLASLVTVTGSAGAHAQAWPAQPLRAIVPDGAGSATDIVPRVVFEQLSQQLGQPIIVESRAGAGETIGSGAVARGNPDGYTMLVNSSAHSTSPALYRIPPA